MTRDRWPRTEGPKMVVLSVEVPTEGPNDFGDANLYLYLFPTRHLTGTIRRYGNVETTQVTGKGDRKGGDNRTGVVL